MKILKKLAVKQADVLADSAGTIVCFGDSNTQGGFECYINEKGHLDTVVNTEESYGNKLRHILQLLYPKAQINYINSGIYGDNATNALARIENSVLKYNPDLVIVSFGTNDCNAGLAGLETYKKSLKGIFEKIKETGAEIIFLTTILTNTYVSPLLKDEQLIEVAKMQMETVENGIDNMYFNEAEKVCNEYGVKFCDCRAKWKKMYENGVDTTALLSNCLNHPIRELHWLFAYSLVEMIFEN